MAAENIADLSRALIAALDQPFRYPGELKAARDKLDAALATTPQPSADVMVGLANTDRCATCGITKRMAIPTNCTRANCALAATPLVQEAEPVARPGGAGYFKRNKKGAWEQVNPADWILPGVVPLFLQPNLGAAPAPLVAAAEPVAMPAGWVPCTITYEEGEDPEEVAFGPQRMMDRLKKWLDAYFAKVYAERYPVATGVQATEVASEPNVVAHETPNLSDKAICLPLVSDNEVDALCAPGRAARWQGDGRQYDRDTVRLALAHFTASAGVRSPATEMASPVVGAASVEAIMELVDAISSIYADLVFLEDGNNNAAFEECHRKHEAARDVLRVALATPSQQEDDQPVAEIARGDLIYHVKLLPAGMVGSGLPAGTLLYTRADPPARSSVPLTDERIDAICALGRAQRWKNDGRQYDRDTARLIEAAHGIVSPQSPQEREA